MASESTQGAEPTPPPVSRHLSVQLSNVSTDSLGFPSLRSFEAPARLTKGPAPPPAPLRDVDDRTVFFAEKPVDARAASAERARLLQQAGAASPPPCRKSDINAILALVRAGSDGDHAYHEICSTCMSFLFVYDGASRAGQMLVCMVYGCQTLDL